MLLLFCVRCDTQSLDVNYFVGSLAVSVRDGTKDNNEAYSVNLKMARLDVTISFQMVNSFSK